MRHNRLGQIFAIQSVAMDKISTNKATLQSSAEILVLSYLCTQLTEEILFFDKIICVL